MALHEENIRAKAAELLKAIEDAMKEGFRIVWPHNHAGLAGIAVSQTAKVKTVEAPPASAEKPATLSGAQRVAPAAVEQPK